MIRHRMSRRSAFSASVEGLEARQLLTTMYGLTSIGQLAVFESTQPGQIRSQTTITGLQLGENLLGIDSRPATGQLYGLGSTGRLYTINPLSGASSLVGSGPIAAALSGTEYDIDFNPVADRLRIVSDGGVNLRVNPDSAEVVVDANLAYAPTDVNAGVTAAVIGAAYTNNVAGAGSTTLFDIERNRASLTTQGSVGGAPISPNTGTLFTSSSLKLGSISISALPSSPLGFEITPSGEGWVSQRFANDPATTLLRLDLNSGVLAVQGSFPSSLQIVDITTAMPGVVRLYAVTTNHRLISFRSDAPATLLSNQGILGTMPGEMIRSIDVRPATGQIYGLGSLGRLYLLDPLTGQATVVSTAPISPAIVGTRPSIDFNPTADRIRLVTNAGQNLVVNPETGAVASIDTNLFYSGNDSAAGIPPSIVAEAYSNSVLGATTTTLFALDSSRDTLVLQGSPGGAPIPPGSGELFTVGSVGRDLGFNTGLDVAPTGRIYASITDEDGFTSSLFIVNPSSGALTRLGTIGGGVIVSDLTTASVGVVQFASTSFLVNEDAGSVTVTVSRSHGDTGAAQVGYSTMDGTARAGVQYTAVAGILEFADGEVTKTITIPIRANSIPDGVRNFRISLANATNGLAIGVVSTTEVVIAASAADVAPGIAAAVLQGNALSITSVEITFRTPVDAALASDPSRYLVRALTAGGRSRLVSLAIDSVTFDSQTGAARLTFGTPLALRNIRSLQIVAKGFGADGFDATANYTVQRGIVVKFTDLDGDRAILTATGRNARIIVVRRVNEAATYAWVEGRGRAVFGSVIRTRRSNRRVMIDRFVTNGARLRLPNTILVDQVVIG